jgi:error-prone DNA polymerase
MVALADMEDWERAVADFGLLGLSPSYHPLGLMRPRLPLDLLTAEQLRHTPDGARARTAGMVICRQRPDTAKGFMFLLLEDETGMANVVIRPDLYAEQRIIVRAEPYVIAEGVVQNRGGTLNLIATHITPLMRVPGALRPDADPAIAPGARHPIRGERAAPAEPAPSRLVALRRATPASHDFH